MERLKYDLGNGVQLFEYAEPEKEKVSTKPEAESAPASQRQLVSLIVGRQEYSPVAYTFLSKNAWENFRAMRRDPVVSSCLDYKCYLPVKNGWEVEPATEDNPQHQEQAEFIKYALQKGNIEKIIDKLMDAVAVGYSVQEKIWGNLPSGEKFIKDTIAHDPQGIAFEVDENWKVGKIITHHVAGMRKAYPANRFIYWAYNPLYEHPYGHGDFLEIFRAWYIKYQALVLWTRFVERNASGTRVYTYANGTTEEQQGDILDQLEAPGALTHVMMPEGDTLEIVTGSASDGGGSFSSLMAMCDTQIARGILGSSLMAEEGNRTGSMAQSKVHADTAKVGSEALARMIECVVNEQIIAPTMRVNYPGETEYPKFKLPQPDIDEQKARLEIATRLLDSGVLYADETWWRPMFGFPADFKTPEERESEREEEEAKELENALMLGKEANKGFTEFAKKPCGDKGKGECDYDTETGRYGGGDGDSADSFPKQSSPDKLDRRKLSKIRDNAKDWTNRADRNEHGAVYRFVEGADMDFYVNSRLRGVPFDESELNMDYLNNEIAEVTADMDSIMATSEFGNDHILYRGTDASIADKLDAHGGFTDKGFMFTTKDPEVAAGYMEQHDGGVLLEVKVKKGHRGIDWSDSKEYLSSNRKEVILDRGSQYRVAGKRTVKRNGSDIRVYTLEVEQWQQESLIGKD